MVHLSVLVPYRSSRGAVAAEICRLVEVLTDLGRSWELIIVDDHSSRSEFGPLQRLLAQHDTVRLLRLDQQVGISGLLTAGLAAARGERLVVVGAGYGYPLERIADLLAQLVRSDLVVGRPRRRGLAKAVHRLVRIPRWLLLGLEIRDPECLFWAARREAVSGLDLPRCMYRYLATLVAMRGYRVGEVMIPALERRCHLADGWPNAGDLLAAWWLRRRWLRFSVEECCLENETQRVIQLPDHEGSLSEAAGSDPPWRRQRKSA